MNTIFFIADSSTPRTIVVAYIENYSIQHNRIQHNTTQHTTPQHNRNNNAHNTTGNTSIQLRTTQDA